MVVQGLSMYFLLYFPISIALLYIPHLQPKLGLYRHYCAYILQSGNKQQTFFVCARDASSTATTTPIAHIEYTENKMQVPTKYPVIVTAYLLLSPDAK